MAERGGIPGWAALTATALLTALALAALQRWHGGRPATLPVVAQIVAQPETPVHLWLSTADQRLLLAQQPDIVSGAEDGTADVVVDLDHPYQTMVGFGAALTDSSAWLIRNQLDGSQRAALLRDLFGPPPGLNFNLVRLTIGASDFSLQHYTLDDLPAGQVDPQLQHFNVAVDQLNVIPLMRDVLAVNPQLRIIASPWSAPAWMKTSANLIGGTLLEEYEPTYAAYLVRYVEAMRSYGIPIFALTVQNEPAFEPLTYPGMLLPADVRARLIGRYLGPMLASEPSPPVILDWDHNWDAPDQPLDVLADPDASRYVAGVAWHCYRGAPAAQTQVHRAFPQKDVYLSECSSGDWASIRKDRLLWYTRDVIMAALKNWARGVVYWNLALDQEHGPHAGGCDACTGIVTIDAPASAVVAAMHGAIGRLDDMRASGAHGEAVDAALDVAGDLLRGAIALGSRPGVVHRTLEYYAFAHFSRFVLPGAVRVRSSAAAGGVDNVAFRNAADGSVVLVVVNSNDGEHRLSVRQGTTRFQYSMPAYSLATFVWQPRAGEPVPAPAPAPAPASSAPSLPPIPLPPLPTPEISVASSTYGAPR